MIFTPSTAHLALGDGFFDVVRPADFPQTLLRWRNQRAARSVGLDGLDQAAFARHFARFEPLPGSLPQPIALRYHGHQFRSYNPEIGDGRGFLFAQCLDEAGRLLDFGTKGSGQTPYSRFGDGRLTLKGGVREALASANLEALGVYTSKSFALFETGERLMRNDEPSPTRSSALTRLSHSHIRIGTFQRLLAENDVARIGRLVDHCIRWLHPSADRADMAARAAALLAATAEAVGALAAEWMAAGFVHGVLNTDNIVVTGESFDYGPWRFLPRYDPGFTAAYFDHTGLYAFGRQPGALAWNLERFAECLTPLAPVAALEGALGAYAPAFHAGLRRQVSARLGVVSGDAAAGDELVAAFFQFLNGAPAAFERTVFDWHGGAGRRAFAMAGPQASHYQGAAFERFFASLSAHEPRSATPDSAAYFDGEGPITLLHEDVEAIWAPIAAADDWSAFDAALARIETAQRAFAIVPAR